MLTKPLTSVIILLLVLVLIHSSYLISNAAAAPKVTRGPVECGLIPNSDLIRCCQDETDSKGITITWCTVCDDTVPPSNCTPRFQGTLMEQPPTPTPTGPGIRVLPGEVLEELTASPSPTPPPSRGKGIFGSDIPTLSVSPGGGSPNDGGKVAEQPPTIPTAPTTPPTVSSPEETDQGDGDKKPPQVKDLPGIDITEQPEVQQQEQGEQPSNVGQGPAGPLT